MCEVPEMSLPVQWTVASCKAFLESLDWSSVKKTYASYLENESSIPADIRGVETEFPLTDISAIEYAGEEYCARDRRRTFAMRIGYLGHCFNGFQLQRGAGEGVYTVQDDLLRILGKPVMASGRTDKHVSALSQIISFHTFDESITAESIHGLFAESEASSTGRLKLFQCVRVPRKFHALFLATWRRYIYLLPLPRDFPVDVALLNSMLSSLLERKLSYRAFQIRETSKCFSRKDPLLSEIDEDVSAYECTLLKARCWRNAEGFLCFEIVGDRFLRYLVRTLVGTALLEVLKPPDQRRSSSTSLLLDMCLSNEAPSFFAAQKVVAPAMGLSFCGVGYPSMKELMK